MCENNTGLADIGLRENAEASQPGKVNSRKRKRNIDALRAKRLRRNKRKNFANRNQTRRERLPRMSQRLSTENHHEMLKREEILKMELDQVKRDYKKERKLSAFCWNKYKEQLTIMRKSTFCNPRHLARKNLKSTESNPIFLGKGSFGKCVKMDYRGITVAVKRFESHVSTSAVKREASVLSQLDHPGLPLFLGLCVKEHPFLMVTQFYGVNGQCVTINKAIKTTLLDDVSECARLFKEIAEALGFLHNKKLLHNDIKGDNVVLTSHNGIHSIIIDFGKARKVCEAKQYTLTQKEQEIYKKCHWHIAPELISGTHKQSFSSDIFSFGIMFKHVCKYKNFKSLTEIARECMHTNPLSRPNLLNICKNLSQYVNL